MDTTEKKQAASEPIGTKPSYHKEKPTLLKKEESEVRDFLLDHPVMRTGMEWIWLLFITAISAFLFAYGYRSFVAPIDYYDATNTLIHTPSLISGGASGMSQSVLRIMQIFGYTGTESTVTSISYFIINIPLFFIAWKFIGHKFTVITFINVALSSLFIKVIPQDWTNIFSISNDYIARALVAGILTGLSSGLAYMIGSSAGGIDIITFAIAERKSTTVGKYSVIANTIIVLLYTFINAIRLKKAGGEAFGEISLSLYTCIYFFTSAKTLDLINIKNKKNQLQINTDNPEMATMLLRAFPHGCTVVDAIGGYTGKPRKVIFMVVSASEVKQVVDYARRVDPECFVNVTSSNQVYGKFYTKPIK
jgi:uncharacterized membrane-anchored protein YitT (DUF2179 family)